MPRIYKKREERYRVDAATGCWNWLGYINPDGYGWTKVKGRAMFAHRFHYEEVKGPVPEGLELDHLCRNGACVNPDHLEAVSHTENIRRRGITKLTKLLADKICERYEHGEKQYSLARDFGVSQPIVSRIVNNHLWAG